MKSPYSGAYSRRRFSNFEIGGADIDVDINNKKTLSVKWDAEKGSVSGSGNFNAGAAGFGLATAIQGDTITLEAHPADGYHFVRWGGAVSARNTNNPVDIKMNTNNPVDIKMNTNCEVTAVFEKDIPAGDNHDLGDGGDNPLGDGGDNPPDGGGNGGDGGNGGGFVETKVTPFVKQWWWAILIVAYIAYKEWKGSKR